MSNVVIGIIGLALILLMFLTGIELGFAMALVGFVGFSIIVSMKAALNLLAKDVFDVFASYGFTVIPLFVLMGQIAFNAGIAKRLYDAAYRFIGHIPGGLAIATVLGATAFKAICGSSPATAATFASVAVPEMDRYHYDKKLSTGIVATVGTLGILIPPSVTLIVFGIITEQSIGRLFLAGIIPGLIIALFFIFIIYGWCKINPSLGPKGETTTWRSRMVYILEVFGVAILFSFIAVGVSFLAVRVCGFIVGPTTGAILGYIIAFFLICLISRWIYRWSRVHPSQTIQGVASILVLIFVGSIFFIIVGGLMKGFFTPTEAGSIGTAAVLFLSMVIMGDLDVKGFIKSVAETLRTACMVLILIAGSTILGHFLAVTKIPMVTADWILQLPFHPNIIMILIGFIYLIGGSFIDDLAFMILATPIFYPVVIKMGYDPLWFAMIICITVMIGVVIPPVAINVFVVKNITKVPFGIIYKGVYPFLIGLIVCAALLFIFPQICLYLPRKLMSM